jgi:hypothetical protein
MAGSAARAIGPSSRYTVLTASVSKTLHALRQREITQAEQRLLERAADLLKNIVQGSQFIERKDAHALSNPSESLFTVSYALTALSRLGEGAELGDQMTNVFEEFEKDLRRIAHGERLSDERLELMGQFFDALRALFYQDLAEVAVGPQNLVFRKPSSK